ncbi:MAG: hypothetical protein ACK2T3_14095 [Candidatus Promineifilaceae bacterium]|jgi:hypothetical protein
MGKAQFDIVTLKPRWSVRDLFSEKTEAESRESILAQLNSRYLSHGWTVVDDIKWDSKYRFAVVKLGPPQSS